MRSYWTSFDLNRQTPSLSSLSDPVSDQSRLSRCFCPPGPFDYILPRTHPSHNSPSHSSPLAPLFSPPHCTLPNRFRFSLLFALRLCLLSSRFCLLSTASALIFPCLSAPEDPVRAAHFRKHGISALRLDLSTIVCLALLSGESGCSSTVESRPNTSLPKPGLQASRGRGR